MRCLPHTRYPGGSILTPVWYTRRFPTLKIRATPASAQSQKINNMSTPRPCRLSLCTTIQRTKSKQGYTTLQQTKFSFISNSSSTSSRLYKIATRGAAQLFPFLKTPQPRPCPRPLYFLLERRVRMGCMRRACSDNPLLRACIEQAKRATEQTRAKHKSEGAKYLKSHNIGVARCKWQVAYCSQIPYRHSKPNAKRPFQAG